jgi:hypothetical protein
MDDQLVKLVCDSSVHSAVELISVIHRNLEHSHRSSAWHAIYCMCTLITRHFQPLTDLSVTFGATVLLLCTQICPAVSRDVLQQHFEDSWDKAHSILDYYRVQRPVARQSIQTLKTLRGEQNQTSRHLHTVAVPDIF